LKLRDLDVSADNPIEGQVDPLDYVELRRESGTSEGIDEAYNTNEN
jgi:hypothetical protein